VKKLGNRIFELGSAEASLLLFGMLRDFSANAINALRYFGGALLATPVLQMSKLQGALLATPVLQMSKLQGALLATPPAAREASPLCIRWANCEQGRFASFSSALELQRYRSASLL
jgi:hypothetical protein